MDAEQKAHAALTEGRLKIDRVQGDIGHRLVVATCIGSTGETYRLGFDPRGGQWRCTCEANSKFHRKCSHLIALQLVVIATF